MHFSHLFSTLSRFWRGRSRRVYADYSAGTPLDGEVLRVINRVLKGFAGNPSSVHLEGREAREILECARRRAARTLSVHPEEIVFTSGGTESNNLAILGILRKLYRGKPLHAISSVIEHSSVLEPLLAMERLGLARVTLLPVDERGRVSLKQLRDSLQKETSLVSLALANGEIGSMENIRGVAQELQDFKEKQESHSREWPYLHTDASQAALYAAMRPKDWPVDLLTLDSFKMYGPPGSGLLYVRRGLQLEPIVYGGGQEKGLRAGSENFPFALALAEALERAERLRKVEGERLRALSLYFIKTLSEALPQVLFNSFPERGLPHIVNISVPGLDGEFAAVTLDAWGISSSSASACRSISAGGASYVVEALPGRTGSGKSSLRFSFGRESTKADVNIIVRALVRVVSQQLSQFSFRS